MFEANFYRQFIGYEFSKPKICFRVSGMFKWIEQVTNHELFPVLIPLFLCYRNVRNRNKSLNALKSILKYIYIFIPSKDISAQQKLDIKFDFMALVPC